MILSNRHNALLPTVLLLLVASAALLFVPAALNNHIIGYTGKIADGEFQVITVLPESPAERAGFETGDVITHIDQSPSLDQYRLFREHFSRFLNTSSSWRNRDVAYTLNRKGKTIDTVITSRQITLLEVGSFFGARILFCIFLLSMTVVILVSGTRSVEANLFVSVYLLTIVWLLFEARYWPVFGAPLIPDSQNILFKVQAAVSIIAVQLVNGFLLLIALQFPRKRQVLEKYPRTDLTVVITPLVITMVIVVVAGGTFFDMIKNAYAVRLWLNSFVLVCALALFADNYRSCDSALQKEQSRWLIFSFAVVVVAIVGLWKIPILLTGSALIPAYDWLLAPVALIPLSMTISINNHKLFGIRGILGYRQKIVEARLEREKNHVRQRDDKIRSLADELDKLKSELSEFTVMENFGVLLREDANARIVELEQRFPHLRKVREEKLLGKSPIWVNVFENVALATYGTTPVLVCGESGTGKTDVARTIHKLGDRNKSVFKEISCAQFEHADPAIALGRLFGIGTGHGLTNVPRDGQAGLLAECDNGSLFLDDFDCLPGNVQNLLLYPLEGKAFELGIGKGKPVQVSVKFILATNSDPEQLVTSGKLRGDILARLGSRIDIPPLRERKEDIDVLVSHFIRELCAEMNCKVSGISEKAHRLLNREDYREGNARQLKAELRHAIGKAILERDSVVRAGYLSERMTSKADDMVVETPARQQQPEVPEQDFETDLPEHFDEGATIELAVLRKHRFRLDPSENELGLSHKSKTLSNHLRGLCIDALTENEWDFNLSARSVVGSDDHSLVRKIEGKIRRYCANIKKCIVNGDEQKLFNNLPARYHQALSEAISKFRVS
jgi:DNA-binding NtrC family response regulator